MLKYSIRYHAHRTIDGNAAVEYSLFEAPVLLRTRMYTGVLAQE